MNRAGEPLNNQEIRNVAFRGPLNDAIYEASNSEFLRQKLKITGESSSAYRDMLDAEYVLRFLMLKDRLANFSGNYSAEMDTFMRANQAVSQARAQDIVAEFVKAIDRCRELWGNNAFQRPEGTSWRDQMLAGLYDAQMISVHALSDEDYSKALSKKASVISNTRELFKDDEFDKSVRTGTNTPARVRYRVDKMLGALIEAN